MRFNHTNELTVVVLNGLCGRVGIKESKNIEIFAQLSKYM